MAAEAAVRPATRRDACAALGAAAVAALAAIWPLRASAQTVEVRIQDYKFIPERLSVKVGTRVKWTNHERRTTHSVLFTGPAGFESERLFPDESYQRLFDKPGSHPYSCGPHPEMKGHIEVTP